jgi:hypothetical protein
MEAGNPGGEEENGPEEEAGEEEEEEEAEKEEDASSEETSKEEAVPWWQNRLEPFVICTDTRGANDRWQNMGAHTDLENHIGAAEEEQQQDRSRPAR